MAGPLHTLPAGRPNPSSVCRWDCAAENPIHSGLGGRHRGQERRGARNPELDPVVAAARKAALIEDGAIFNGYDAAGIVGIGAASAHAPISLSAESISTSNRASRS
ncbi:encapsulin [Thioalkalivibrio sp.]|uniref:encapsulin n=1 Tax=Thioalkalivibrio sp. TaxID=2093813 RepID=UPI0025EE1EAA|nr:encapsulin [Thioalkalivibrio sp.]